MESQYLSFRNLNFLLYDVHHIYQILTYPKYAHIGGREEMQLLLQGAKDIADRELYPYFKDMDDHPVKHADGKIHSHPQLKKIFKNKISLNLKNIHHFSCCLIKRSKHDY